jgi:RND superfamily putative drug exporter
MFEKRFEALGNYIGRNKNKIIVLWIIVILAFLPFASLLFSQTSYNMEGSVVTKNSMSSKADALQSAEFPSSNNSSTADLILLENANVSNSQTIHSVIAMQNAIMSNPELKKYNVSVSSIYTVENTILTSFVNGSRTLYNSTLQLNEKTRSLVNGLYVIGNSSNLYMKNLVFLAQTTEYNYLSFLNQTNGSISLMFLPPQYYTGTFLMYYNQTNNISLSESYAYKSTLSFISEKFGNYTGLLDPYFNTFTVFWNISMVDPAKAESVENYSIYMTLYNSSFASIFKDNSLVQFWQMLGQYFNVYNYNNISAIESFSVNFIANELSKNATVSSILPLGAQSFTESVVSLQNYTALAEQYAPLMFNSTIKGMIYQFFNSTYFQYIYYNPQNILNYTFSHVAAYYQGNSTLYNFIANILNIPVISFVQDSYESDNLTALTISDAVSSYNKTFDGNPLTSINEKALPAFFMKLNDTGSPDIVANIIATGNFTTYPIIPSPYTYHKLVSYTDNVSMILVTLNPSAPNDTLNVIQNISDRYLPQISGVKYYVAGSSAMAAQLENQASSGLMDALLIGIIASVIISLIFFRSPIAGLIPLTIFGMATVIGMGLNGLIYKYVLHASVSFITPTLMLILLLGLTTDYSVYILARFRRELINKNDKAEVETVKWAGHAVFTSGVTVVLSYLFLWLADVPIFSDSGLTNAISVTVALVLSISLLPSLLKRFNEKIYWPNKLEKYKPISGRTYHKIAKFDRDHKKALLAVFVAIVVVSVGVYLNTPTGMDIFQLVPHGSALTAVEVINSTFKGDAIFTSFVIMQFSQPVLLKNGSYNPQELNVVTNLENKLLSTGKISFVYGPTYPFGSYVSPFDLNYTSATNSLYLNQVNSYIGTDNKTVIVNFQLTMLGWTSQASNFVSSLKNEIAPVLNSNVDQWYIGGLTQGLIDVNSYVDNAFTMIVPILALAIFAVLLMQLSSVFTPLRLVLMVLGSVTFALVIAYGLFYYIYKIPIIIFMPMFVVITLLAVGLDYDIFMITRAREEVMKGNKDEDAIEKAIVENGGIIMVLGLILMSTFGSLYFSGMGIIQEIGVALAMGVFIATFVSWMFFIPSVMLILKSYNWWPSKIQKK